MPSNKNPRTGEANGQLWGARARDWADFQEGTVRPVYEAVLERTSVKAGTNYLDAGCGSGMAAMMASNRGAHVSGADASDALLDIARERVPDGDFSNADLEELPFADRTFDVVTGFNSFQYAGNRGEALAEAGRVTKKDGQIIIMTWGQPEGMEAGDLVGALKHLMPPPPPGAPGPFALSDEAMLREFAKDGGLTPIEVFDVDSPWYYPDEKTALRGILSPGVAIKAIELVGEQAVSDAYRAAFSPFKQTDGSYKVNAWYRCLIAKP